jgi:hypothetical protein
MTIELTEFPDALDDLVVLTKERTSALLDLFRLTLTDVWAAMGEPLHRGSNCGRSMTACSMEMARVKNIVHGSYDKITINFDRHGVSKKERLHFLKRMDIIEGTERRGGGKVLYIQHGSYPFITGITDATLGRGMIHMARALHHNWISPDDFTFTEVSIHGTYTQHREDAWVVIRGTRNT